MAKAQFLAGGVPLMPYKFDVKRFTSRIQITADQYSNGMVVINIGTSLIFANGIPLHPGVPGVRNGESFTFGGNIGEVYRDRLDITMENNTGAVIVVEKIYLTSVE